VITSANMHSLKSVLLLAILFPATCLAGKYNITDPTVTTNWKVGQSALIAWDFTAPDATDSGNTLKLELRQSAGNALGLGDKLVATLIGSIPTIQRNYTWTVIPGILTANTFYVHLERIPKNALDLIVDKTDSATFRIEAVNTTSVTSAVPVPTPTPAPTVNKPQTPSTSTAIAFVTAVPETKDCDYIATVCQQRGSVFMNATAATPCQCANQSGTVTLSSSVVFQGAVAMVGFFAHFLLAPLT
jgi:hypothetical protein